VRRGNVLGRGLALRCRDARPVTCGVYLIEVATVTSLVYGPRVSEGPSAASNALYTRENNIDAIRLALALIVIFSHSYSLAGQAANEPLFVFTKGQTTLGTVAVDFFFVLSGFLVSVSFVRARGVADYLRRRFLRIYPGYFAAALFTLVLVAIINAGLPAGLRWDQLVLRLIDPGSLPCKDCFAGNALPSAINGSLWTLRYEIRCYVFVVLVGLLGCFRTRQAFLVGITAAGWFLFSAIDLGVVQLPKVPQVVLLTLGQPEHWPELFAYFAFGTLASVLLRRVNVPMAVGWPIAAIAVLVALARLGHGFEPALVPLGSYCLYWVAAHPKLRLHGFAKYGDFSYGTYVYAFPVQQAFVHLFPGIAPLTLTFAAAGCTLPLAVLSWRYIEKPAIGLAKRWSVSPRASAELA
jgi:peptidoglycan/LPS O-acetylase OafA/YrhL